MADAIEISNIRIELDPSGDRRAYIANFEEPVYYGMHGGVQEFYGRVPEVERPSTLDHIVAAAGGWLTGTLSGALVARQIPTTPNKLKGSFKGTIEAPEGVLKITKLACHYDLIIPKGTREKAERALNVFDRNCPVSQTLKGSVEFEHTWTIKEEE